MEYLSLGSDSLVQRMLVCAEFTGLGSMNFDDRTVPTQLQSCFAALHTMTLVYVQYLTSVGRYEAYLFGRDGSSLMLFGSKTAYFKEEARGRRDCE